MGKLGEAVVEIRPDMRALDRGLAQAEGKLQSFVTRQAGLGVVFAGLGAAGGIGGIATALADATLKAADLGESAAKVEASFGDAGKVIDGVAEELARKFGVVKKSVLDGATSIGLVGTAAGMASPAAARLGADMVRLGVDVESFSNVPLDQVLAAFRSGLVGESEPMRQFGVLLSEDAVKAEALRVGLVRGSAALSEQAKVLARLSLIKGSPAILKMVGDLERTAGSGKNQLRKFMGDIENLKTEIGQNFIDPMTEALQATRELGASLDKVFTTRDNAKGVGGALKSWLTDVRYLNKEFQRVGGPDTVKRFMNALTGGVGGQGGYAFNTPKAAPAAAAAKPAAVNSDQQRVAFLAARAANDQFARMKRARDNLVNLELKYLDWAGSKQGAALSALAKAGLYNVASKGLVGGLVQTRKEVGEYRAQINPPKEKAAPGSAQTFDSGADFARFAAERALESRQAQEQVNEAKKANMFLDGIDQGIKALREKIGGGGGGVVLKGKV